MRELGSRPGNDRQASSPVPGGPTSEAQDSRFQSHFFTNKIIQSKCSPDQKDQPARMRIAKRTAHRLLSRSDPNGPLLRSVQDNVFVQNVGDHA